MMTVRERVEFLEQMAIATSKDYLVETGTDGGGTVEYSLRWAERIDSIEIDPSYYMKQYDRFRGNPNVYLYSGDSRKILPLILRTFDCTRSIFWLDAHIDSGAELAEIDCPLLGELEEIRKVPAFQSPWTFPPVLIDDADKMGLTHYRDPWPSLEDIRKAVPDWKMRIFGTVVVFNA